MTWKTHCINDGQPVSDSEAVGILTKGGKFYKDVSIMARLCNWTEDKDDLVVAYERRGYVYL